MAFVTANDNPRRERCLPELNPTEDDLTYWLDHVDMFAEFDAWLNDDMWDEADHVASISHYVRMRRAAISGIKAARTPGQVYHVVGNLPPDFFTMEDDMILTNTWLDGQPLNKGYWSVESYAEDKLKRVRITTKKRTSVSVRVAELAPDEAVLYQPIIMKKGGTILRAMTMEQKDVLLANGYVAKG